MPKPETIKILPEPPVDLDRPLDVEEMAKLWGISPRALGDYARAGAVPCHKIGPQIIRFWPREVYEFTRSPRKVEKLPKA